MNNTEVFPSKDYMIKNRFLGLKLV